MTGKLFVLALLGALVLINVYGDDDFKEVDNMDEVEDMIEKVENDEESETRVPRTPRLGRLFRFGRRGGRTSRSGGRIFRRTRTRTRTSRTRFFGKRKTRKSSGSNGKNGGGADKWTKVGTVVDIAQLGLDAAQLILKTMSNAKRKILVALGNMGETSWQGGSIYMKQGSALETIPNVIDKEDGVGLGAEKKPGPSTTGVSGVVCYRFKFVGKSFCVMFKVPYRGGNYWNVKVYNGAKQASGKTYNDLQKGAIKAGTPVAKKKIWSGNGNEVYIKDCSMTKSSQAVLHVYVEVKET